MIKRPNKIQILSDSIANKIAAGEVVERPASVVKELIENSLDAGATSITVRLLASGLRLIEVIDNGCGMSEQDATLSIERHATSKIQNEKDLESIQTFGFRGEALNSISAVSQFTLITRRPEDPLGTQVIVNGGVLQSVSPLGCPSGTKITVSRLFFNTPVRLKFLKGLTTELSHCIEVVQKYAMAHIGVGFKLYHNERLIFEIAPEMDLRARLTTFWGKTTISDMIEIPENSVSIETNSNEYITISLYGYIGLPSLTRSTRSHQLFFVNKRPVYSRALQFAVEEAYRSLLVVGRYPVVVLFVNIPPAWVDVNIHPTKREIKLRDERHISKCITELIRDKLGNFNPTVSPTLQPLSSVTFEKQNEPSSDTQNNGIVPKINDAYGIPDFNVNYQNVHNKELAEPWTKKEFTSENMPLSSLPSLDSLDHEKGNHAYEGANVVDPAIPKPLFSEYTPPEQIPMQIFDSYLVISEDDRLIIIDQHALHERLNFEQLKKELQEERKTTQKLVIPLIMEVPPNYCKLIEENVSLFEQIGIDIELFGENTFQISGICPLYDEQKIKDVIFEIAEEIAQGDLFERENYYEDLLRIATKACKKSIKAGDKLEPIERVALVQGFKALKPPYTCPHGRPIILELTLQQMEKSFRRKM